MDGPIWIQVGSLTVVALAFLVSAYQVWLARNQTRALEKTTEAALTAGQAEARQQVLYSDPELLAWHLRTRGCEGSSHFQNKQRYYIINKLVSDEVLFTSYRLGYMDRTTWDTWTEVIKQDALVSEAQEIWPSTKYLYAKDFVVYVEQLMREAGATNQQLSRADLNSEVTSHEDSPATPND